MDPETRYLRTPDGVHIAYQIVGDGPYDLMYQAGWLSNLDAVWDMPEIAESLRRMAERARVILMDRRGTGVSDRPASVDALSLERAVDDTLAVLDAAGSERAVLFGFEDGCIVDILLAASQPSRVSGLVLFAPWVSYWKTEDHPWGWTIEEADEWMERLDRSWGTDEFSRYNLEGLVSEDRLTPEFIRRWTRYWRLATSPAGAMAIERMEREIDVRAVLPAVRVPTLVMHRAGDDMLYRGGRWIAEQMPGARFIELPGAEHPPFVGDTARVYAELDAFVASIRAEEADLDRVLATVLFTDIAGSTAHAATMGDRAWRDTLERHHALVRGLLARYRGTEVDTAGDGFLATFDGPARAVRCASAIVGGAASLGLEVRAGCHTGEIEMIDGKVGGLAVHVGARVGAIAQPSEVLVSSTVKDLTAGSGLGLRGRRRARAQGRARPLAAVSSGRLTWITGRPATPGRPTAPTSHTRRGAQAASTRSGSWIGRSCSICGGTTRSMGGGAMRSASSAGSFRTIGVGPGRRRAMCPPLRLNNEPPTPSPSWTRPGWIESYWWGHWRRGR